MTTTSLSDHLLLATNFEGVVCSDNLTAAPDITAPLNSLFSSISAYSGSTNSNKKVYFPKGFYRITGPVVITRSAITADHNANFILDGPNACLQVLPYGDYASSYEVFIEGISLTGINGARTGLLVRNGSQFNLRDVSIFKFETGIELTDCDISHISRPTIQHCKVGILFNYTTGISITQANFFANETDNKFLKYNSGINFTSGCYFENFNYSFLLDSTSNFVNCTNINIVGATFATSQNGSVITGTETAILKVIGKTNGASLKGFNFFNNRIFLNHPLSKYAFSIITEDIAPSVSLLITSNTFYNQIYFSQKLIYTNSSNYYSTAIIYEDNINTNDSFDIVEGRAWLTGLDRGGTHFGYANKLHGPLVLDKVPNVDISSLPGALFFNQYTNQIQYIDNNGTICSIPNIDTLPEPTSYTPATYTPATYMSPSNAKTLNKLKTDLNTLIQNLKDAGLMSSS